jgi:lysine 6-dehydrogenase
MRLLVLGAGAQGSACALDLARSQGVEKVILADVDVSHLRGFLKPYLGKTIEPRASIARRAMGALK